MSKRQINRYFCIAGIVISIILMIHDLVGESAFKIGNLFSHIGLFLFCAYLLFLNLKVERKEGKALKESSKNEKRGSKLGSANGSGSL